MWIVLAAIVAIASIGLILNVRSPVAQTAEATVTASPAGSIEPSFGDLEPSFAAPEPTLGQPDPTDLDLTAAPTPRPTTVEEPTAAPTHAPATPKPTKRPPSAEVTDKPDVPPPTRTPPPHFIGSVRLEDYCLAADGTEQVMVKAIWVSPVRIISVDLWIDDTYMGANTFDPGDFDAWIASSVALEPGTTHVGSATFKSADGVEGTARIESNPYTAQAGDPCPTG